ncbi:MAG: DNA-directed RNA polymerase subunit beta' [candidate division WWE3 bacterium GW2011_GWC1_47_10]|uniref:DNA-directed RNA polymerase subunit beta' n=1 Tax=candidate division WWE3 bacterium GW2011_GWC1_47_10 TaxID=1619122 RepID=A0A0G1U107_UNCKA|nr:MAG: DNA-directed RNA polymerase subunit beta' [candidate division WWE3 bacterium GW2011_GWC1_47_10]
MQSLDHLKDFDALRIYLASKSDILSWSFGEVLKPETINYRTFRPERDGLFDERIFGPMKDYECYCGKYKRIRYKGVICDKCGVEVTHSRVRRERMGHIALAAPVAHVWFFKGIPSKMALLLDISPRNLESIIYFSSYIVTKFSSSKKASAISAVQKAAQAAKTVLEQELEKEVTVLEKQIPKKSKGEDFAAQEMILKVREQVQKLRNLYVEKIDELESEFNVVAKKVESVELHTVLSDGEYLNLADYIDLFATVSIGAEAVYFILHELDLTKLCAKLREDLAAAKGQKAHKISRRLEVAEGFRKAGLEPERMIFAVIPITPPDLRPMVQLEGGRFATSDLNDLYRRVINRNNRLKRLLDLGAPEIIVRNEKRMLQEAVDALFDSSKQRQPARTARGRKELRSLTDMLKGKQGRFRQNLLGKRVDYSGRSVIVNGPELKLHECGIPKEMALEMFKPFVLREILAKGYAPNPKSAKFVFESRAVEVWDILEELVKDHPVLLNRAPTLWRLGIQAFYPKLVEGNAIRLHLCVCVGYNADFDGDAMAVHLPLSEMAIKEAKEKMLSTKNLLSPADGAPISVPMKILLFGIYYMTSIDVKLQLYSSILESPKEALYLAKATKIISLRQKIKVRLGNDVVETTAGRLLFNEIIPQDFGYINDAMDKKKVHKLLAKAFDEQTNEVVVKLIDDLKDLGLAYGTLSGHSIALSDITVPKVREQNIEEGRNSIAEIDKNYKRGLITKTEAQRLAEDTWNAVTAKLDEEVWQTLTDESPVKTLLNSGASRASRDQIKQIAGMKGPIADPTGKIVEMPILGNFKIGLSGLEYFTSARGARKGLADKALKTADSGYLTRRLVDVAQDVLIREEDCGATRGRTVKVGDKTVLTGFVDRFVGRYLAEDVRDGRKILAKRGVLLTPNLLQEIEQSGVKEIKIRTPYECDTRRGVCVKCYGVDVMTKQDVKLGVAIGVAAAQAIGEPGTQLTMRTFHTGGIAGGKDITQGLPRIEEIVEARAPKYLSIMSETTGTVKIVEAGDDRKIQIIPVDDNEAVVEYQVDPISEIVVEDKALVTKGERLTEGHLDLTELLRTVGVEATKKYIVEEIQHMYASQGVSLNDKHVEVIVKQMFNSVRVDEPGDTNFLPGQIATRATFEEENERVLAEGGTPAISKVTLLGITKASLETDSFLSAASFIQTSNVLTDAAASGRVDRLLGLKENVIIGRLIPTAKYEVSNNANN